MLLKRLRLKENLKHRRGRWLPAVLVAWLALLALPAVSAQAACSVGGMYCVRDDFSARAYDLNTGTDDWATDWVEDPGTDGGPTLGVMLVPVTPGELRFQSVSGTDETNYMLSRDVFIPVSASNATLLLSIGYSGDGADSRFFEIFAAKDGGTAVPMGLINGNQVPNPNLYSYDLDVILGAIAGSTVTISLKNVSDLTDTPQIDYWFLDFVEVNYDAPLAVALADFGAEQHGDHVQVAWETVSELDNQGFNLYRSTFPETTGTRLNQALIPSQAPGSSAGFVYTWQDRHDLVPGTAYYYRLEDVSLSGATTLHGPASVTYNAPTAVTLSGLRANSPPGNRTLPAALLTLALLVPLAGAAVLKPRRSF